jgi:formylmethanofuran dehydrogenase subunit D
MKDLLGACLLGAALGAMLAYGVPSYAQTYVVTNPQGQVTGYIQQNGNTVNVLTPNGNTVGQPMTLYPNQIVTPSGSAIGVPSYTVPMTPPSPPSVRVLQ